MIPAATEKAGLPDEFSVLGVAVFAGVGIVIGRSHLYSIRSPPQEIVGEGSVLASGQPFPAAQSNPTQNPKLKTQNSKLKTEIPFC
jgi:hypothetical protein